MSHYITYKQTKDIINYKSIKTLKNNYLNEMTYLNKRRLIIGNQVYIIITSTYSNKNENI